VYEAPNWYGAGLAASAVITHDAVPFTTGTAWQMAELENSGVTEVPFSVKSTTPEVTGLLVDVSSTVATTVSSSPYGTFPFAGTATWARDPRRRTVVVVWEAAGLATGVGIP
jgi:hypothetical protein